MSETTVRSGASAPTALPCLGHVDLYDTVLYEEDVPAAERATARHQAAALCARCPSPCDQKVTADTQPRKLVLLEPDWMPPAREGKPEPKPKAEGWRVPNRQRPIEVGRDYVRPDQRPAVWARMAAGLANDGRSLAQIAQALCVSEDTARALLAQHGQGAAA